MKFLLLATVVAFLLSLAVDAAAIATTTSLGRSCVGDSYINADNNIAHPDSGLTSKDGKHIHTDFRFSTKLTLLSDLAIVGDQDLDVMLAKRIEQGTAEAHAVAGKCIVGQKCPMGYVYSGRGDRCYCIPGTGIFWRNADLAPREDKEDSRTPFDPHVFCLNNLKDRCAPGTVGLWDKHAGRCYCGPRKANIDLNTREEAETSPLQVDYKTLITEPMLTNRLLPQPLKFPTGISNSDWTAIQATLALLYDYVKSQSDLHQVCTGAKHPKAFGFKLEIFRRICAPDEIYLPVSPLKIQPAEKKVNSALFIDTMLKRYNNNYGLACHAVKPSGAIPHVLDKEWILTVLCN